MRERIAATGFTLIPGVFSFDEANDDPWGFAERILGEPPALVERQPIRPIPNGRSFASGTMETPLHTDSQLALGIPPAFQLMLCVRQAESGGESVFCDGWSVLDTIAREDRSLFAALFQIDRRQPFVFGDVYGPTVSRRGGHVVFTHSALCHDPLAARLTPFLNRAATSEVRPMPGDLLVANNHRLLHGRRGFKDTRREFVRLLVYAKHPLPVPEHLSCLAQDVALPQIPRRLSSRQSLVVEEMIRGVPPGLLSHREGVVEADLYAWRDTVLATGSDFSSRRDPRGT